MPPVHTKSERKSPKNKAVSRKVKKLKAEGKSQDQAVAQAINTVRRKKRGPKGAKFT